MKLPQLEVYAIEKTGRKSAYGYLQQDGSRVILKPKKDFSDQQVIRYLYEIQMQGIPHIWGETKYQEEEYLIASWIDGEQISAVNLSNDRINQLIFDVLALIDRLRVITGMYWFFLDLKPQHIILDSAGRISLIDFEHVVVCKEKNILVENLNQLGISPIYSSAELKTGQFSQQHHEYALALIWLSLLSKKSIEDLTIKNRKRILRQLDPHIRLRIESGLRGEGIRKKSKGSNANSKIVENLTSEEVMENTSTIVAYENDVSQTTENGDSHTTCLVDSTTAQNTLQHKLQSTAQNIPEQNVIQNSILQIVQKHMQDNLLIVSEDYICGYKEHRFFECYDSKKQEIVMLTNIKSIMLCDCHALPILVNLKLAFLNFGNGVPATSEIFQEINLFSHELQTINLLTKNLASHIVKKYFITDLYISNEYLNLCGFPTCRNFDARQIQEYKSGEFAINSKLRDKISEYKHRLWR
ncbi:MAG: hypothetical protein GX328_02595 [Clostridiaceae bacterium]|nr:hypothetical protein [Clostridiaceae bacterium]